MASNSLIDTLNVIPQNQQDTIVIDNQLVLTELHDDGTATITLNRPRKRNALSAALITSLTSTLRALDLNDLVRVIILTGSPGGPFSGTFSTAASTQRCLAKYEQQRVQILASYKTFPPPKPSRVNT